MGQRRMLAKAVTTARTTGEAACDGWGGCDLGRRRACAHVLTSHLTSDALIHRTTPCRNGHPQAEPPRVTLSVLDASLGSRGC